MHRSEADWSARDNFSHLYVEEPALDHPVTRRILANFPTATVVPIAHYKSLFNRPRQNPDAQRRSRKLILAMKRPPFLYGLSSNCQSFGITPSFYTTPAINCLFNCDYCYLHGMTETANIVAFVNIGSFFAATTDALQKAATDASPMQLNLSYDTDLLALEKRLGLCRDWIAFTKETPGLLVELRTKSGAYGLIDDIAPTPRFILAWSLSPDEVGRRYEHGAPPLKTRLKAAARAASDGWPIRLCFDPIIPMGDWRLVYRRFFEEVFDTIPEAGIREVSAGCFRMGQTYHSRIRKWRPGCDLYHTDFGRYQPEVETEIYRMLSCHIGKERIEIWK